MQKILGISAFYHDSAACITVGNEIVAAAQEERFTRKKHTEAFPIEAIKFCLEEAGLKIDELDAIVFYDKPFLKFERLLETYYAFSPKGLLSFLMAMKVWLNEKLFLKKQIYKGLAQIENYSKKDVKLLFSEHHLSHAASTFFTSKFEESAILTVDGVGEWSTASIAIGRGNKIEILKELHFPHSIGLLYSAFTYYLGFTVNSGEYKVMGLAPYGNPDSEDTKRFVSVIKEHLVSIKDDGSIWLDQSYFSYATGLKMIKEDKWAKIFGVDRRAPESELEQVHTNLALAIQIVTEEVVLKMAIETNKLTGSENLCMAGGVALNCVSNGKLIRADIFNDIYVQSASGDAGGAIGACLAIYHMYFNGKREIILRDTMKGAYLGPYYSEKEVVQMNRRMDAKATHFDQLSDLTNKTGQLISEGNVIGWFQGRMEFGPRALGNRSIIGDARNAEMQKKINLKIKYRESFRPFAPSVLAEDSHLYFDLDRESPYMLLVAPVAEHRREKLPDNFYSLPLMERLYVPRSDLQSITHLDFSARVQTVDKNTNERFWTLLHSVKKHTGDGMVLNTSFNVRGEPIVCSPEDAYRCFMSTEMDYLVVNDFLYKKEDQEDWENKKKWERLFAMD